MKQITLALGALLALSTASYAQQGGPGGGSMGGSSGPGGGGSGGARASGGGGSGGSGVAGNANANAVNAGIDTGSLLGGFNTTGQGRRSGAVSPSNPFAAYYANPYAAGVASTSSAPTFGTPVFGNVTGGTSGSVGAGSGFGNRSGFGATGGMAGSSLGTTRGNTSTLGTTSAPGGGFTSMGNTGFSTTGTNRIGTGGTAGFSSGGGISQLFAPPAPSGLKPGILYSTTMRFKVIPPTTDEVRTALRNVVGRSTTISVPQGVTVDYDSGVVVLRGQVTDDDERRHVENLVRLSPGVHDVRNELSIR